MPAVLERFVQLDYKIAVGLFHDFLFGHDVLLLACLYNLTLLHLLQTKRTAIVTFDADQFDTSESAHTECNDHSEVAQLNIGKSVIVQDSIASRQGVVWLLVLCTDLIQTADQLIERLAVNHKTSDSFRVVGDYIGCSNVLPFYYKKKKKRDIKNKMFILTTRNVQLTPEGPFHQKSRQLSMSECVSLGFAPSSSL